MSSLCKDGLGVLAGARLENTRTRWKFGGEDRVAGRLERDNQLLVMIFVNVHDAKLWSVVRSQCQLV
jgi:hypothetical protein